MYKKTYFLHKYTIVTKNMKNYPYYVIIQILALCDRTSILPLFAVHH